MKISFSDTSGEKRYALTISKVFSTKKGKKDYSSAGRIISSTTNRDIATSFNEEEVSFVRNYYNNPLNLVKHQILLDKP